MEHIVVKIDPDAFDRSIRHPDQSGLPILAEGGDLAVYVKPGATTGGKAGAVLTFTVQLPDGSFARAQCVTTAALLETVGLAMKGWREGGHI
jgi:hypothetical protein